MGFKDWFDSKSMWFRWGLKSWFYAIIIFWIIFVGTDLIDDSATYNCQGLIQSNGCGFFEFIANPIHWIIIIILSFIVAIIASIIGKIKSKKIL